MPRRRARRARRGWAGEAVLEALRTWAREEGRAPRAYEWAPWAAAALGVRSAQTLKWEREPERWPSLDGAVRPGRGPVVGGGARRWWAGASGAAARGAPAPPAAAPAATAADRRRAAA